MMVDVTCVGGGGVQEMLSSNTSNTSANFSAIMCLASFDTADGNGLPLNMNIDNRIEQAMDLVKTHLMYAVREEVDRLRFRIGDLERKIAFLEAENALLRKQLPNEIVATVIQQVNAISSNVN